MAVVKVTFNPAVEAICVDQEIGISYSVLPEDTAVTAEITSIAEGRVTFEDGSVTKEIQNEGVLTIVGVTLSSEVDDVTLACCVEMKMSVITIEFEEANPDEGSSEE